MTDVVLVHGQHVGAHLNGNQHGVSIQSSVGETLFRITR